MPEKRDDWRAALEAVVMKRVGETSHPELAELAAYHAGDLDAADEKRVQDHLVLCRDCTRLLLELDAFAVDAARAATETPGTARATETPGTARATETPGTARGTETPGTARATETPGTARAARARTARATGSRRKRWRRWATAAAAPVAAALLLVVWPSGEPLTGYGPPVITGELLVNRGPADDDEPPVFAAGQPFTLRLQPDTAIEEPVRARVYLRRGDDVRVLSAAALEIADDGVVSLDGVVGSDLALPEGESELLIAVARPGELPSREQLANELAKASTARGRSWIAFRETIRIRGAAGGEPADDDPWVTYAGCHKVLVGPVCVLDADRELTIWVRHHRCDEIRIDAGGGAASLPATEIQGGCRFAVTVDAGARELAVEAPRAEGRVAIWTLALEPHAPDPDWLTRARERYRNQEGDAAREILEPYGTHADPAVAGPALNLLARNAGLDGDVETRDRLYPRAIDAHRRAGRLSDQIRDAAGWSFYLIHERRFEEARENLDALPLRATGGADDSRNSIAFARALLAEETGDLRAALEWATRAVRAVERADFKKRQLFAENVLARLLVTVGLVDDAAELQDRMQPRIVELSGGRRPELNDCDRAIFEISRAWTALLALEAGRRPHGPDPDALLDDAERLLETDAAQGCLGPGELPNLRLNRALAALHAGDPASARADLERARVDADAFPRLALWQLDVEARLELAENRPDLALERYRELARGAELGASPEAEWRAAFGEATALEALAQRDDAIGACSRAETLLDAESLLVPIHAGRALFLAQRERAARFCVDLLLRAGRPDDALAAARRSIARALRGLRVDARIAELEPADRALRQRAADAYSRIRHEIDDLTAALWQGVPHDEARRLEAEIARRRGDLRALVDELSSLAGAAEREPETAPPGTLLLVYHPLPAGWAGFAAGGDGIDVRRLDPGDETGLEARADAELASLLLEPFAAGIARAARIEVIAYGDLRAVDFHALPFDGDVLLETAPVVYRLDLPAVDAAAPPVSRAVVVAGPGLLAAPAEARQVREALEAPDRGWQVQLLEDATATRDAVLRELDGAALLHYAGHVVFDLDSRGWDSHLTLAAGGRLGVDDVLALPEAPRWVVLSGCDTGRDSLAAALPNVGLAQAFLVAGAEAVVAATDVVTDRDAAALMAAFYRRWDPSSPPAATLRQAQRELRARDPDAGWRKFRVLAR